MGSILVVGCVSNDVLHIECGAQAQRVETIGGAGLYTALAAAHQGVEVVLFAPRPEPMPPEFAIIEEKLIWLGPHCEPDQMPALEIKHHGGGRATLVGAKWGAEDLLTPDCMPELLDFDFDIVHIAALSTVQKQNEFADFFKGAERPPAISAGTYARAIQADRDGVRKLLENSKYFFMNSNEAQLLFDEMPVQNDRVVFVTSGADGVTFYRNGESASVPADAADELDPTGAGDTFCGTTLALIYDGAEPVEAAKEAVKISARAIEQPGPAFFLQNLIAFVLVFIVSGFITCERAIAAAPDLGNAVGMPEFILKNKETCLAGRMFAVKLRNGKSVLVTPLHLLGPSTGFDQQFTVADCKKSIASVNIRNLTYTKKIGTTGALLLNTGDLSQLSAKDLTGDLLAFARGPKEVLNPIKMVASLPVKGATVFVCTREQDNPGSKLLYFEGQTSSVGPKVIEIKLKKPLVSQALSGSPVVDEAGSLVGMVYGKDDQGKTFFLNPGAAIYKRLNSEIE